MKAPYLKDLATQGAWDCQRKICKAERRVALGNNSTESGRSALETLGQQIEKLRERLRWEYTSQFTLICDQYPDLDVDTALQAIDHEDKFQMDFSLRMDGSYNDGESLDIAA